MDRIHAIRNMIEKNAPAGVPVAMHVDTDWLLLGYHAQASATHEYIYLYDVDLSQRYISNTGAEVNYRDHGQLYPKAYAYRTFLAKKQPFAVLTAGLRPSGC